MSVRRSRLNGPSHASTSADGAIARARRIPETLNPQKTSLLIFDCRGTRQVRRWTHEAGQRQLAWDHSTLRSVSNADAGLITRDRSVELKSGAFQSLGPKLPRPTPNIYIVSVVHVLKLPTLTPW